MGLGNEQIIAVISVDGEGREGRKGRLVSPLTFTIREPLFRSPPYSTFPSPLLLIPLSLFSPLKVPSHLFSLFFIPKLANKFHTIPKLPHK